MSGIGLDSLLRDTIREVVREENDRLLARVTELLGEAARPSSSSEETPFFTVKQAAAFAGVTERTIRDWVRGGELSRNMAGRLLRVRVAELEQYIASSAEKGESKTSAIADDERVAEILASVDRGGTP